MLEKYGVQVIGVQVDAIERGEDRQAFKDTMNRLGIEMPRSEIANSVEEAEKIVEEIGLPCVIRPAYTMGGTGGGLVYNVEEFRTVAGRGLAASLVGQILVEESVLGWEELELEVVRDAKNQMITVCFIENVDAMGVHTGDSLLHRADADHRPGAAGAAAEVLLRHRRGHRGHRRHEHPVRPRSRRPAAWWSSRSTRAPRAPRRWPPRRPGFPIAFVSSLLAGGLTMDEIPYWRDGTLEKYTPSGDYVVVKFARWAFEKFEGLEDKLGTQMRAVGEVMSIGKTYKEAFQKAIRSLENGRYGLGFAKDFNERPLEELMAHAGRAVQRAAVHHVRGPAQGRRRAGAVREDLHQAVVHRADEGAGRAGGGDPRSTRAGRCPTSCWRGPRRTASPTGTWPSCSACRRRRSASSARRWAWSKAGTPCRSAAWRTRPTTTRPTTPRTRPRSRPNRKVMVLGGGPNRIGQGIEFDYCCVHAAFALRDEGFESIMVNCNPETVSTDYDTSDKLYFEPLTVEDVLSIYEKEKPEGVIVQFGGQTPLNIAAELEEAGREDPGHLARTRSTWPRTATASAR